MFCGSLVCNWYDGNHFSGSLMASRIHTLTVSRLNGVGGGWTPHNWLTHTITARMNRMIQTIQSLIIRFACVPLYFRKNVRVAIVDLFLALSGKHEPIHICVCFFFCSRYVEYNYPGRWYFDWAAFFVSGHNIARIRNANEPDGGPSTMCVATDTIFGVRMVWQSAARTTLVSRTQTIRNDFNWNTQCGLTFRTGSSWYQKYSTDVWYDNNIFIVNAVFARNFSSDCRISAIQRLYLFLLFLVEMEIHMWMLKIEHSILETLSEYRKQYRRSN